MKRILALSITSLFLLVLIGCGGEEIALSTPSNFAISAATDEVSVVLDWDPNPADDEVDGYIIYFDGTALDTTTNETYTHDNPGVTGDYDVTAYQGDEESDPSTTLSTTPIIDTGSEVAEIGVPDEESGYGWNTNTGQGTKYSMVNADYAGSIDFYFTDWAPDYVGTYEIDSPSRVTSDPGATHLQGTSGWRVTGFYELTELFDDVTVLPLTGYDTFIVVGTNTTYGVYTEDGHYAMVEVQSYSTSTGMVQIRTAFQTVPGLAILEH